MVLVECVSLVGRRNWHWLGVDSARGQGLMEKLGAQKLEAKSLLMQALREGGSDDWGQTGGSWWWQRTRLCVQEGSALQTEEVVFCALGEPTVVGDGLVPWLSSAKILPMLLCLNRCLFADDCHINNTTGLLIILKFRVHNNFGKMPLCKEYKPRVHGQSEKRITVKSFHCGLSVVFKKDLLMIANIYWVITCVNISPPAI